MSAKKATVTLLIEIGVEELPTKAVTELAAAGRTLWARVLDDAGLPHGKIAAFGSPRRLAWRIHALAERRPNQKITRRGPSLQTARNEDGTWSKAALGFARSCGVAVDLLGVEDTAKGPCLMWHGEEKGRKTEELLPPLFEEVIRRLPIEKRMRWGDFDASFVRPVNTLLVLADDTVWALSCFGVSSGNKSQGHRVHHPEPVVISHADAYEAELEQACVLACQEKRENRIRDEVRAAASRFGGKALLSQALVREVAALSEWPVAVPGNFAERFLDVPQEVLITTMQDNQKTFALVDGAGKLLPHFIAVANLDSQDPDSVARGNERVIRPRFADAEFFWRQDLKRTLEDYLPRLEQVLYHERLGSLGAKTRRVGTVAAALAVVTGADKDTVATAAKLAKSDLLSEMVIEFPDLQGLMGRHYADKQGLGAEIAAALEEQYYPIGVGGALPETATGTTLALAEKLDTLVGGFAIGARPTGSKDPYALRRMAIGLIRLIIEKQLPVPLDKWLKKSAATFPSELQAGEQLAAVRDYILERLHGHYRDRGVAPEIYQAVRALDSADLLDVDRRINALQRFIASGEAASLLSSAKRIRNILRKNGENPEPVQQKLFSEAAEKALDASRKALRPPVDRALANGDYPRALTLLGRLADPLEMFFNEVMVISEDATLRNNRLALLTELQRDFDRIADLSVLGG